jgi:hypothetical protein
MDIDKRICTECGEPKHISEFPKGRKKCKTCTSKYRKDYNMKKKESKNEDEEIKVVNDINVEIDQPDIVEKVEPVQAKKRTPKKKATSDIEKQFYVENLKLLLVGGFNLISKKAGNHWNITEIESENIAKPAINILTKIEAFNKFSEHSDIIALGVACVSTIIPRLYMSVSEVKTKNDNRKPDKQDKDNITNINTKTREVNRKEHTINDAVASKTIFSEIQDAIM